MIPVVRSLFSRVDSFFDAKITSQGVLSSICDFIILNYGSVNPFFPHTRTPKQSWKLKFSEKKQIIGMYFGTHHSSMRVVQACLANISPSQFWYFADLYSDLVRYLHVWIRLMRNSRLNGGVPWFTKVCFKSFVTQIIKLHNFFNICSRGIIQSM